VTAQNTEQQWFQFCVTSRRIAYYPRGVIHPQFGNHWLRPTLHSAESPHIYSDNAKT